MEKASLRKIFLQKRMDLTEEESDAGTDLIIKNVFQSLSFKKSQTIHIFLPQPHKREIDTWKIIAALRDLNLEIKIVAPYVVPKTRKMQHYTLDDQTHLIDNQWNIPEPDPLTAALVDPFEIDLIFLPLLAFDKRGFRVGYGGGYYDRFLAECRPDASKVGICFFEPIEIITDIDPYDIPMTFCFTPKKIWKW